jgi:hypothetical protein
VYNYIAAGAKNIKIIDRLVPISMRQSPHEDGEATGAAADGVGGKI